MGAVRAVRAMRAMRAMRAVGAMRAVRAVRAVGAVRAMLRAPLHIRATAREARPLGVGQGPIRNLSLLRAQRSRRMLFEAGELVLKAIVLRAIVVTHCHHPAAFRFHLPEAERSA